MSARENLVDAYEAWEQCTRREGQAIQDGNWVQVGECQRTKQELQEQILRYSEAAGLESKVSRLESGVSSLASCVATQDSRLKTQDPRHESLDPRLETLDFEPDLGQIIHNLILMEMRNGQLVAARRQTAESQKADAENAFRNLRRVKSSYAPPALVAWHSYS